MYAVHECIVPTTLPSMRFTSFTGILRLKNNPLDVVRNDPHQVNTVEK
jgi:hypothetical protein